MAEIDYPRLVHDALLGVVRAVLQRVAAEGLPGEHHFYVSFRTDAAGVELPAGLRQRFPREMTIVLQHQFWGLEVDDAGFSVTLRFAGTPTSVRVPWDALTAFADPSVSFGLRLAADAAPVEGPQADSPASPPPAAPAAEPPAPGTPPPNVVAFRRRSERE
jgi:hypothetical protein